ncbi:non-ribosomal peptide synthetase, partial [Micromonospora sp. NPDC002296]
MGDLRRPLVWPARAGSVVRAVELSGVVGAELPGLVGAGRAGAVVLAGLVGVLARYTGQEEVALGLAAGGGLVRVGVAGDPGFAELVSRVGAAWAAPVVAAGVAGPVVVGVVDGPVAEVGPAVVDVDVVVTVASDGSGLRVDYAAEGFSAEWVRGLVDHVVTLVSAGVREPGVPLSRLPLLGAAERERLLAWGQGPVRPV